MRKDLPLIFVLLFGTLVSMSSALAQNTNGAAPGDPWPRQFKLNNANVLVYQPQVDSWENNILSFRAVVSITPNGSKQEILGVIWAAARTQVNRVSRILVCASPSRCWKRSPVNIVWWKTLYKRQ